MTTPGGDDLVTLALMPLVRLSDLEWRIVILVRAAHEPVSAREIARRLHGPSGPDLRYSHVKSRVRRLVARGLLERSPEGLWFEPAARRWVPAPR